MPSAINKLIVVELAKRFAEMGHALLADFTGLSAQQADALRAKLGEQGAGMMVVKNSLAILALRQLERLDVAELVDGPTAFIYGGEDPVTLAKTVVNWGKGKGKGKRLLELRGGMVGGRALDAKGAAALAALPTKQVLRSQVVGVLAAPLTALVGTLNGVMRGFVGVLRARAAQQGEGAE